MSVTVETLGKEIIEVASRYVGLYETVSNSMWSDKQKSDELNKMMKEAGWQKGWPYCAALVEGIWHTAYKNLGASDSLLKAVCGKLNPSTVQSRRNFQPLITKTPTPGAIFFMQKGTSGLGHAGIVVSVEGSTFKTIEGNTSPQVTSGASDREGDGIFAKTRAMNFKPHSKLYLVGFLNPIV